MPRDYKHHSARGRKRNPVAPWIGLLAGLLIGLFIAFLVYIKMLAPKYPEPAVDIQDTVDTNVETATETAEQPASDKDAPPKPRFEFYAILPEMEVIVPEEELQASTVQPPPVVEKSASREPAAPQETYYLQAGGQFCATLGSVRRQIIFLQLFQGGQCRCRANRMSGVGVTMAELTAS